MDIETGELVTLFLITLLVGYCVLMRRLEVSARQSTKGTGGLEEFLPELRKHGVTNLNWTWSSEEGGVEEPIALARKVLDAHRGKALPRTLAVTGESMGHPLIERLTLERAT